MQHATWFTNSIAVHACNWQEYYRLHITICTEGNVNCLSTFALQLLSMWALLMVITTMYAQLIVMSKWYRAVSVTLCCLIGHLSWMVTYTCPCTDSNTKIAPVRGIAVIPYIWRSILSKSERSISHSYPEQFFSGFVRSLNLPNTLLFHGGTMVELHCIPPLANLHYDPLASTLKQC